MATAKELQRKRKIAFEDFEMKKIKLKEYGADVMWVEKNSSGGRHIDEVKDKPHPDLVESLDNLIPYFADRIGLNQGLNGVYKLIDKKDLNLIQAVLDEKVVQVERCSVNGVSYSGEDQLKRIIITGSIKVPGYGSFSIGCPGINLNSEILGYEEEIIELCDVVIKEAYNYLFTGKITTPEPDPQLDIEQEIEKQIQREEQEVKERESKQSNKSD